MYHGLELADIDPHSDRNISPRIGCFASWNNTLSKLTRQIAKDYADDRPIRLCPLASHQRNIPIAPDLQDLSLGEVKEKYNKSGSQLQFWLDDTVPAPDTILLFLKRFNAEAETLSGFRCIRINWNKKINELSEIICPAMNWPTDTEILYFEVGQPLMIYIYIYLQAFSKLFTSLILTFISQIGV